MPAKRARDLSTTCGLLIEAASYLQRGMHDDVERATGLSGAWLEVLLRLHRTPGGAMRINEIAAQVTLPASSFSRLADRMEEEGLVERHPDPRHRRATLLHLTSAGEQRFAEAWKVLEPSQQARVGKLLSGDELDMLETDHSQGTRRQPASSCSHRAIADSASGARHRLRVDRLGSNPLTRFEQLVRAGTRSRPERAHDGKPLLLQEDRRDGGSRMDRARGEDFCY